MYSHKDTGRNKVSGVVVHIKAPSRTMCTKASTEINIHTGTQKRKSMGSPYNAVNTEYIMCMNSMQKDTRHTAQVIQCREYRKHAHMYLGARIHETHCASHTML